MSGTVNNSNIADYMAKAIEIKLSEATQKLFVPSKTLKSKGYDVTIDLADITNPVLVAKKNGKEYRVLENKNYLLADGIKKEYNGINVYNGTEFFVPQAAVDQMK